MTNFEDLMEFFCEEVIDLGKFTKGVLLGRQAREALGPEVLADPHDATAGALECLSEDIAKRYDGSKASMRDEGTSSRVLQAGLVNILFACLPDPDVFEDSKHRRNPMEMKMVYNGFKEFIEYLSTVIGRKGMENICDDPLLGGLFSTVDRAVASQTGPLHVWEDELRRLAWDTRVNAQASTHKPLTIRILEYLRWEVRGRKDMFCTVKKPWNFLDPWRLRRLAQHNPSPLSELRRRCAICWAERAHIQCSSCHPAQNDDQITGPVYCTRTCRLANAASHGALCEETRRLSRLALLFQIIFVQYLLCVTSGTKFVVSEDDGVFKCFLSKPPCLDVDEDEDYVGISPDLDLSLPKVDAALHGFRCCDIKAKAIALLEFFFRRRPCTSIQFLSFVPKNAHTPLEVEDSGWFRFNMSALHTVAVLTTSSRREFILDPTAAQFGWNEHLVARDIYTRSRVDLEWHIEQCIFPGRPIMPTEHTPRPTTTAGREYWTSNVVVENLLEIAEANFRKNGGLDGVLQLPQAEFREQRSTLKVSLESEMLDRVKSKLSSKD